ncbi:hypothetical protein [Sphingomonas sanguinis]|jgi:hypothetical protein|uniref:Uncharacterized protein n=1 Tax=Sphingomonas sanguinis TaxID=33051 RepID=A0A7Y7URE1_9SPHN|nr:hypothetical protein [Sphingomonas sanguinis]MBZ6382907.1 hypothetical protein [Sphingomonas sanguinis]NNG51510.1 hypothetical protein [Sphingomonas sanguinis]NNG52461.1 hypothetical protein [Sphingomonas sanguinis]NVP32207.1 hypothetical protein [Sphingomonas sanguinis]
MPNIIAPSNDQAPVPRARAASAGPTDAATRILCLSVLGAALAWAASVGVAEWRVQSLVADRMAQASGQTVFAAADLLGHTEPLPPRGALSRGLMKATAAFGSTGVLRRSLIVAARRDIDQALHARPIWPAALVGQVFLDYVDGGVASPGAHRSLAASYRAAPFLPEEGEWRVRFGLAAWPWLTADARQHVLDEGVWQAELSPTRFEAMTQAFRETPAAAVFRARLLRHGDHTPPSMSSTARSASFAG